MTLAYTNKHYILSEFSYTRLFLLGPVHKHQEIVKYFANIACHTMQQDAIQKQHPNRQHLTEMISAEHGSETSPTFPKMIL